MSAEFVQAAPPQSTAETSYDQMRERQRFDWFARRLADSVGRHDVDYLTRNLMEPPFWPGQREKALVLLALDPRPEAATFLAELDDSSLPADLRPLLAVARG